MATQIMVPSSKYGIKCPYSMSPQYITIHNTANDASARNEAKYMISNNKKVSFHFVVDDKEVVQCVPLNRNAWHAGDGNGTGNRKSIGIEICYSKSGGSRFTQAEINAAILTAQLLKERGWGIDRVKRHKDWSGKNCPHRTMSLGWERWLNIVRKYLGQAAVPVVNTGKTAEDGSWGKDCTRKSQKVLGTTQDGIVSRQPLGNKKYLPNVYTGSWKFTRSYKGGSALVKAIQRLVGAVQDGLCGKKTIMAMQIFLKARGLYNGRIDGIAGYYTVLGWQMYINSRL